MGAVFDFTEAIGFDGALAPGAETGPVELRLRVQDPLRTPNLRVEITGRVERVL